MSFIDIVFAVFCGFVLYFWLLVFYTYHSKNNPSSGDRIAKSFHESINKKRIESDEF